MELSVEDSRSFSSHIVRSSLDRGCPCRVPGPFGADGERWPSIRVSGCLGIQPESGGKLYLRLNTGTSPIVNKYREGKLKRTLEREFKRTWNRPGVNRWDRIIIYIWTIAIYWRLTRIMWYVCSRWSFTGVEATASVLWQYFSITLIVVF